ncbi:MAG: Water stress and hypersensitive response domain-containing protein [Thiothrix sp.]|nr:MAG: Water stress and hypersensitive response domain-containing protein [Thiothrix sp.]
MKLQIMLFGAISLLSGCAAVPNVVAPPSISVQDVSLQSLSLTQGTALVALQVTNPNAFPLPLEGIQYNLRLNGTQVASGDQRQSMYLQPNQPTAVQIPVQLELATIMRLAPVLWQSRSAQYQLDGAVRLPFISIPFQRQGGVGVN